MHKINMTLNEINKICVVEIIDIITNDIKLKKHLLEMGLTKGTKIEIKKISFDVMTLYLRDYNLCISKQEQKKIRVKIIN